MVGYYTSINWKSTDQNRKKRSKR